MSENPTANQENELPPSFPMWKTFHNTLSAIFENLDNAENTLEGLSKSLLSSQECSDIFLPRYDPSLTYEQNQNIEKSYQDFTTWLLGRLFYLLSYEKFERIHDLFIQAQQKILIVVRLSHPHIHNALVKEYNNSLTTLNQFLNSKNTDPSNENSIFIRSFVTENMTFKNDQLELTPIFIELKTLNFCYTLQTKLLKLLAERSLCFTETLWLDQTAKSLLDNIVYCLYNSNLKTKIEVVKYLNTFIIENHFQIKKSLYLVKHFHELFLNLETFILDLKNANNITLEEFEILNSILSELFDTIVKTKMIEKNSFLLDKCKDITNFLIPFCLTDFKFFCNRSNLKSTMTLLTSILEYQNRLYPEIDLIIRCVINEKSCDDVDSILQYQIYREIKTGLKNNVVNVLSSSETWKILYDDLNTNFELCLSNTVDTATLHEILYYFKSVMNTAQIVYFKIEQFFDEFLRNNTTAPLQVNFIPMGEIVNKFKQILSIYNINTSSRTQNCLDFIVDTLSHIISFSYFTQWNLKILVSMIEIISYSLTKILPDVQDLICGDFTEEICTIRQLRAIEILSTCFLSVDSPEKKIYYKDVRDNIIRIVRNCATSENQDVLVQICRKLIYFVSSVRGEPEIFFEIFTKLLETNNPEVLKNLSANLGKLICVFSGNFMITPKISDNSISYEIDCLECDFTKKGDDRKIYRISDEKSFFISQAVIQKNVFSNSRINVGLFFDLFESDVVEIRRNVVLQLPRVAKHIVQFHTIDVTKKWLQFVGDEDKELRESLVDLIKPIINNVQNNVTLTDDYKKTMLLTCLETIKDFVDKHIRSGNADIIETILDTIHEFGCLSHLDVLRFTTRVLIYFFLLCNTYLSISAISYFRNVAQCHKLTADEIFHKDKKFLCMIIAKMSVIAYTDMEYNISQSLERISLAFEYSMKDFLTKNGHHLLPIYISCFVKLPESLRMLYDMANLMVVEPGELIVNNFPYIYTHAYLNEDQDDLKNIVKIIERVSGHSISVLKKRSNKVINNELLMHFYEKKDLVLKELYKLALEESDQSSEGPSSRNNSQKIQLISDYLQPRFLGVLVYFDTKLVTTSVEDSVKMKVLQSLPYIIKLMGSKFITSLRHKVLATLRTALSLTDMKFLDLIFVNWDAFVRCCEVDSLGPLLSTIFVSILPLLDIFPQKITAIFKYLIIDNNEKLKEYIPDLFFLADSKVDSELKNVVKRHLGLNLDKSCKEKLGDFLRYISHESTEVRIFGLRYLRKFLEEKQAELEDLILGNNGMDVVLVEIIDVLVAGCREKDEQVRLACAQCIGELGAIEPSHFPRKYSSQSDSTFTFYLTDDSFVVNALTELLRSFQMEKHTQKMNRFALAIQEILKAYGVSPERNAPKHNLWNAFPESMQELMYPLLSSRYTVSAQSTDKISVKPIFGSEFGSTTKDWTYNWTSHLISLLKTDKKKLMQVCKPSLRYDYRTLMMFLPHILVHALLECQDKDREDIFEEFMAVLSYSDGQKKLDPKLLKVLVLKTKHYVPSNAEKNSDDHNQSNCIKVIFVLLDYLGRWLREYEWKICSKGLNPMFDNNYKIIHDFLSKFCKLKIAKCNFSRGEYPRALMYLEQHVSSDKTKLNENLGFLARIYAELEEPDGVAGAMAMKETDPSIEDMILAHNVSGHLQDAVACYERMALEHTLGPEYLQDMLRCYLEADNPFTAMSIASAALEKYPDHDTMFYESQVETYWRLGLFDELTNWLHKPRVKENDSWGVKIGQALIHFRNGSRLNFQDEINNVRKNLIEMLSMTSLEEGVYTHGYPRIIKLHILNELQKAEEIVYKLKEMTDVNMCETTINELVDSWDLRLKVVQSSVRVVEPILRLRRIILEQTQHVLGPQSEAIKPTFDKHIGKYWLKSAEIARQSSIFQQAYVYILKAEQYKPKELFVEKAKLYWAKEEHDLAFSTLKRGMEEYFPDAATFKDMDPSLRKNDRKLCAEAKLLIATYNDETSNVDMEVNMTNYREAADMCREWEKSQVCLAQYYDRIFSTMSDEDKDVKGAKMQIHIINSFGKSLQYGSTYIYQSMPRMLSIWFDCGTRIVQSMPTDSAKVREAKKATLLQMIKLIDSYLDRLPAYMFLSAFSQLVSRICHPVREVYLEIKNILIKLILKYPQHSMWMLMAVSKSAYAMRTKRCQEVLQDDRIKNSPIIKLVHDFNRLADKLIELCNKPISDDVLVTSVNALIRTLPRLLQNKDFSQIMVPIQRMRKLVLPNPEHSNNQYNPFPNTMVYITNIDDQIQVLQSLQRPRKITFQGSDGKKYIHMLKPKDDLRKDFRLMEFNDVVNLYLHREADSRQRRLCIRTYSVVPLNEECGIIEWVDNLVGLRPILMKIYKQRGLHVPARELKSMMCHVRDDLTKKRAVFENQLLPRHPPVLSEWFITTFPDAHCWFHARSAYVRTSAVVSMVGYVLGLGDRHGENILFDSTNGDTVHVDFNCLFNKGETFDWPERVPFRLTHNMVEAMGPLGVEGIFRRTCAVTLKVLRIHSDTLMSIVRPFVYDPLVSWPRNQLLKSDTSEAERTNEQAVEHIRNIELRLQGMVKTRGKSFSTSLSCEGQANNLIAEATNIDNLSQMYIGWGPYL